MSTPATPQGSLPYQAQIESLSRNLAPGDQEDFRVLMQGIVSNLVAVSPGNTLITPGGTRQGSSAPPSGVGVKVTGNNGAYAISIQNPSGVSGTIYHEVSYSPLKSFTSGVTTLPPNAGTSAVVSDPGSTYFFRHRSSFALVNWWPYTLGQ